MSTDYRIVFTIEGRGPDDDDFVDIGFGSSGEYPDIAAALYEVDSIVANWQWETSAGMPDPLDIKAALEDVGSDD